MHANEGSARCLRTTITIEGFERSSQRPGEHRQAGGPCQARHLDWEPRCLLASLAAMPRGILRGAVPLRRAAAVRSRLPPCMPCPDRAAWRRTIVRRSEEHTSELQSLMRSSYAVFCLKKTNQNETYTDRHCE